MRRLIWALVCVSILGVLFAVSGCGMWQGFGRDVEDLGRSMQGR